MSEPASSKPGFVDRLSGMSLARRIMIAALVWGSFVLVGGALALSALYQAQTLDLLEEDLDQTLITLSREMTRENAFLEDGRVTDDEREFFAGDARFQTQYSGQYWAVVGVREDWQISGEFGSKSLWD